MAVSPIGPGWTVTSQQEAMEQNPSGQISRGVRIFFTTTSGHNGSVFVPAAQYANLDLVRSMLADAAAQMVAVGNLSG